MFQINKAADETITNDDFLKVLSEEKGVIISKPIVKISHIKLLVLWDIKIKALYIIGIGNL